VFVQYNTYIVNLSAISWKEQVWFWWDDD